MPGQKIYSLMQPPHSDTHTHRHTHTHTHTHTQTSTHKQTHATREEREINKTKQGAVISLRNWSKEGRLHVDAERAVWQGHGCIISPATRGKGG